MKRPSVARALQAVGRPVFTTREFALLRGTSVPAASQALKRMERQDLITQVERGLWCVTSDPRFTMFSLVPFLAGEHRAYVSFLSALHLHGLIEQIPQFVYAATTGHTRIRKTPVGAFSFHRIHPRFFAGYDWYRGNRDFLIATPEKALVDALYLSSRKSKQFASFPEIDLQSNFRFRDAARWAQHIPYAQIRQYVLRRLSELRTRNAHSGKAATAR